MGRRLTRVERVMAALPRDDFRAREVNFCSSPLGDWQLPGPHSHREVSLGGSVRNSIPKADNRTTAEVIADMVAQFK